MCRKSSPVALDARMPAPSHCGGGSGATVASCWVQLEKCSLEVAPSHPWVSTLQGAPTASEDPQAHPARTLLVHHQSPRGFFAPDQARAGEVGQVVTGQPQTATTPLTLLSLGPNITCPLRA